jgi:hypothetical protein
LLLHSSFFFTSKDISAQFLLSLGEMKIYLFFVAAKVFARKSSGRKEIVWTKLWSLQFENDPLKVKNQVDFNSAIFMQCICRKV